MLETIIYNGNIITLENDEKAEAIYIDDGIIKGVGNFEKLKEMASNEVKLFDLKNKTLIPSFIDCHSHLSSLAQSLDLIDLKDTTSFEEIAIKLNDYIQDHPLDKIIIGFGYDQNYLKEKKHPDKYFLNKISQDKMIIITHISGHMGCCNTLALKNLNIESKDGYLEENEFISLRSKIANFDDDYLKKAILKAENKYLEHGITTVQDGFMDQKVYQILKNTHHIVDVIGYLDLRVTYKVSLDQKYHGDFKLGGLKLFLDGSPQAKTAWIKESYENDPNNFGIRIYDDLSVIAYINKAIELGMQLLCHCNGDAAIDQFLRCYQKVVHDEIKERRFVLVHSQMMRKDQLKLVKKLKLIPSYFVDHVYYWGDIHLENLGQRAYDISPLRSTIEQDILFTLHQDSPVIEPNMLFTIHNAVNRMTRSGFVLNEKEQIKAIDALKAVTINAAYQYFEENCKGSIKVGKMANLVVLDQDILSIDKRKIKDIKVLMVFKEGKIVYQNPIY